MILWYCVHSLIAFRFALISLAGECLCNGYICISVLITLSLRREWELSSSLGCSERSGLWQRRSCRITKLPASSCSYQTGPWEHKLTHLALSASSGSHMHSWFKNVPLASSPPMATEWEGKTFKRVYLYSSYDRCWRSFLQRNWNVRVMRDPKCHLAWGHICKCVCRPVWGNFLWWWKCSIPVMSSVVATGDE